MELAGLRPVALIHEYHNVSLRLKVGRKGGFQLLDIFVVVVLGRFTATTSELMHQRTDQGIIIYIQTVYQIFAALGTDNILIHSCEGLFNLLVEFITVGYNQNARI